MGEVNGREYDFSDIEARIGGDSPQVFTLTAVAYKSNRTLGKLFANTPRKIRRTRGQIDPDGEVSIPLSDRDEFLAALAAASPTGAFGDAKFDITVSYGTDGQDAINDTLEDCMLLDVDMSGEEGTDPLGVTLPLDIGDVLYNTLRFFNVAS